MRIKLLLSLSVFTFSFLISHPSNLSAQSKINSATFGALTARQIGPAVMSGRITSLDAVNKDPRIMYVGASGAGEWKTITSGKMIKVVADKDCQLLGTITSDHKK